MFLLDWRQQPLCSSTTFSFSSTTSLFSSATLVSVVETWKCNWQMRSLCRSVVTFRTDFPWAISSSCWVNVSETAWIWSRCCVIACECELRAELTRAILSSCPVRVPVTSSIRSRCWVRTSPNPEIVAAAPSISPVAFARASCSFPTWVAFSWKQFGATKLSSRE